MPTSPNMSIIYPDDHTDPDTWGLVLNTIFGTTIDQHNHTTGAGVPIPSAALQINADVAWSFAGTNFAITGLKTASFAEVAAATISGYSDALFVNSSDHNLYFRNNVGANVQITSGNTLNVSIVGGIGGDYSSVSALESYVDSTRTYMFQQEVVALARAWAGIQTGDIQLYEKASGISNNITLKSPHALGASYTLTLPGSLPIQAQPMQVSNSGVVTFSGTFSTTTQFIAQVFRNNVVDPINIPAAMADNGGNQRVLGSGVTGTSLATVAWELNSGNAVTFPIPYYPNGSIDAYSVQIDKKTSSGTTVHAQLFTLTSGGVETAQGSGSSDGNSADGNVSLTEGPTLGVTYPALGQAYIAVWATGTPTTDLVYNCVVSMRRA